MKFHTFALICFILIKGLGTLLATWSWFWLLVPEVPLIWILLTKLELL